MDRNLILQVCTFSFPRRSLPNRALSGYHDYIFHNSLYAHSKQRSTADPQPTKVTAEISTYAQWSSYPSANLTIGGIYFDDVSSDTTNTSYSYYQSLSSYTHTAMPSSHVVFNPGTIAPPQLFSYCDLMVEYEDSLANYNSGVLGKIRQVWKGKCALQVYSTPNSTDVKRCVSLLDLYLYLLAKSICEHVPRMDRRMLMIDNF